MILTINGQQVVLKKGSSIEYVSEYRAFTDADDYSMEIELPLADCPQNIAVFGHLIRKDIDNDKIFFNAVLQDTKFRKVGVVVHAGEWVASQKLLASPVARPLINALDYAQRTNTIGSLRGSDVSRSITAPVVLAQSQPQVIIQENAELREAIKRLNERLDEPFVTVNTVTGDLGIKQAQDNYQRLINNKSPKNKRK